MYIHWVDITGGLEKCSVWYCFFMKFRDSCVSKFQHACGPIILPTIGLCNL